ncbi:MAG: hypothetical protein LBU32_16455 [Clostridiales bacterium]|jgi:hypothetical protein|nr:hypothetical protein [Clostridiales bacterium]
MGTDKFPHYSGMDFVPDNAFVIEDAPVRLTCGEHIRSVEFIRRKGTDLIFIEAKSSFANPASSPAPYRTEVSEICEKFIHSLNILSAIKVGAVDEALPAQFDYSGKASLMFILVVRDHKAQWCRPIKRELEQLLPVHIKKIWKPSVYVINSETARKQNLLS